MEINPTSLFRLLLASLIFGAIMGVLYDCIRIQRVLFGISRYTDAANTPIFCPKLWKPREKRIPEKARDFFKHGVLVLQDMVFCLTVGVLLSVLLFYRNNGEFRGFVLIGVVLGFSAYYFTVGKLVIRVSEYLVFAIKTAMLYAIYYITLPFITAGRFLVVHVGGFVERQRQKRKEKAVDRYHRRTSEELLVLSKRGFLGKQWMEKEKTP